MTHSLVYNVGSQPFGAAEKLGANMAHVVHFDWRQLLRKEGGGMEKIECLVYGASRDLGIKMTPLWRPWQIWVFITDAPTTQAGGT
jgi:hypothetical protein